MLPNEDLQRIFHQCSHQGLQASLLGPGHFLFRYPSPFFLESPLQDVCALDRVRRWRVEEPTVVKNQSNISTKLFHRRVFARVEVLHHRAKIHGVLNLIEVPADSIELVRANM